jgi:hypothetical protein
MFGGILDKVTGFLDRRMVLTSLVPSTAVWAAVAILTATHIGLARTFAWWSHLDSESRFVTALTAVALLALFAALLSALEGTVLRLYEGYWGTRRRVTWLARHSADRHRRRMSALDPEDDVQFECRYRNYPRRPEDVMPTRLGNILKGAEQYLGDHRRYCLDAVFFWPRLMWVLPETARGDLADARTSLSLLLNISLLAAALACGSVTALAALQIRPASVFWAAASGAALTSVLAYRSALSIAQVYAELVRSAFDLYRGDLLEQLGFAVPASLGEERELWMNLGQQLYRRGASTPEVLDMNRKRPADSTGRRDERIAAMRPADEQLDTR